MWREYWLGRSTILLILGNFVLPGPLDHYLARTAIKGQQTKTVPALPGRPDNLEHPITPLHRTRGSFSEEAQNQAPLVIGEVARVGNGGGVCFASRRRRALFVPRKGQSSPRPAIALIRSAVRQASA